MPIFNADYQTQASGTAITQIIPPVAGMIARITDIVYETAATPHTITVLRPINTTVSTASAATGQAVIAVSDPSPGQTTAGVAEPLAASDYLIFVNEDDQYEFKTVSSVANDQVTMATNFTTKINAGAVIWACYELGRASHVTVTTNASSTDTFFNLKIQGGVPGQLDKSNRRAGDGDPLLVSIDNATNAGFLRQLSGIYVDASDVAML